MNKNVLNKLSKIESKVELAEVKVDLALIDDLQKANKEVVSKTNELQDLLTNTEKFINQTREIKNLSQKAFEDYSNLSLKFKQATKELGIDFPYEAEYKNLQQLVFFVNSKYQKIIGK